MRLMVEGVSKCYRSRIWGLRDFSLEVGPGILGLLGPNGAGPLARASAAGSTPPEPGVNP